MQQSLSRVEQVVARIRSLIEEGSVESGRLPSEPKLANLLGVSRTTVRQALTELERDGLIVRRHGVGTFVNRHVQSIQTRLEQVWDFDEMIRVSGHDSSVQHVEMSLGSATPGVVEKLALNPGDEVLTTVNVFLADDVPVIYCLDVIPAGLVRRAYRDEELQGPVFAFLENRCNQRIDYYIAEVLSVVADTQLAEWLGCNVGSPLHYFEEVGFNAEGTPVIYCEEYYRPEYFSFKVVRKMTTRRRK
jgi:GntR family transcriptional regulator